MKKNIIVFLFLICLLNIKTRAQIYMHGIGANISIITAKINTPSEKYNFTMAVTHFSYFPRFVFSKEANSSFSIGFPLGAGIGFLNSAGSATGIAWGADAPVVFDYNMGCRATPQSEKNFGWYLGAGFGYMYTGYSDAGDVTSIYTYGPIGRLGVRFSSSKSNWHVTVGAFYKSGLESTKYKTFGFNVLSDH